MIQQYYCNEKLHAGHSLGLNGSIFSDAVAMLIQPFKSDQHLISPLAIFPESHFKVMRIKGMVTK